MKKIIALTALIGIIVGGFAVQAFDMGGIPPLAFQPFPDVPQNAYYANGVAWMRAKGLTNGYSNGNFGPDDAVTRGQLAVIMANYHQKLLNQSNVTTLFTLFCSKFTANDFADKDTGATFTNLCTSPDGLPVEYR